MPSPPIQAITFDLDDTLISRESALSRLVAEWVKELDFADKGQLVDDILKRDGRGNSDRDDFFLYLTELGISPGNLQGVRARFTRELPTYFEPDTAVQKMLIRLRDRNLELAILSNGGSEMQRAKLKATDLDPFFESGKILISGEIGHDKPAPEAFTTLAGKLETPPANTLFVGDHSINDITGAAACGFQTCWIASILKDEFEKPPFDFMISTLIELESSCLNSAAH